MEGGGGGIFSQENDTHGLYFSSNYNLNLRYDMVELPEEVASYDYGLKTAEEAKAEAIGELFFCG